MKSFYKHGIISLLIAAIITLSGCASIVSKSLYPISINSTPSGAKITITDKKAKEIYTGTTPANVQLNSGAGYFLKSSYSVKFEMDGYDTKTVPVEFKMDGWYWGNILFGGLIGILIVDPATGAMFKLDTEFVNENMQMKSVNIDDPSLKVFGYNDIPGSWKEKLIKLN